MPISVLFRKDNLIIVNVCNVLVLMDVSKDAVIDRDWLVSPELEVGITVIIHP